MEKQINPIKISDTLTQSVENCDRGCCAVFECRPQTPNDLPIRIEVPYDGLQKRLDEETIGIACSEFIPGRMLLCRITQRACPNMNIK